MRRLALAIALACVLSGVTRAGEIHTTGAVAASPPTTVMTPGEIYPTGEIPSTGAVEPKEPSTVLTIILTLISLVR
ncbi:MAG TPA: hypothetical protein VLB46_08335 [Pyrinomonadaceae bacterium]|nr:hypothetical protein [Pyrinomonadaceae bacterium]